MQIKLLLQKIVKLQRTPFYWAVYEKEIGETEFCKKQYRSEFHACKLRSQAFVSGQ